MFTSTILWIAVSSLQDAPKGAAPLAPPSAGQEDDGGRANAEKLIKSLTDTNSKTEQTSKMAVSVQEIVEAIQKKSEAGDINSATALQATGEVQQILLDALDKLEKGSKTIQDDVKGDVLPYYEAQIAGIKAKLGVMRPDDNRRKDYEEAVDRATTSKQTISDQLDRLALGIDRIGKAKEMIMEQMDVIQLWKRVDMKADELAKKLAELNGRIEKICRTLEIKP